MIRNIEEIFNEFVPRPLIKDISKNYEEYKYIPLAYLGIDSLVIIGIVSRIDKLFDLNIDYEKFDINVMKTLQNIEDFVKESTIK